MIHAFDIAITVRIGSHCRMLSLAELSRRLEIPEARLRWLLVASGCPEPVHTPPGDGNHVEGKGLSLLEVTKNENGNENINSSFSFRGKGKEPERTYRGKRAERLAVYLADRLHDWKSYRFFLAIAESVPEEVVIGALGRALDIPEREVRRSRAAYFTTLVRRYLATRTA